MHRTTLVIQTELKRRAQYAAKEEGVSFGEYVRRAIQDSLDRKRRTRGKAHRDVLFRDSAVYRAKAPADLAEKHDTYLYD